MEPYIRTPEEQDFWVRAYLIALRGYFTHNQWNGVECIEASKVADKSLKILRAKNGSTTK